MNLATIAIKNTRRNLFRTVLTVFGVAVAMLAFLLLRTVLSAWLVGVEYSARDRLATRHKITFIMGLPKRYVEDVRGVQGVTAVTWFNWFGGKVAGKEDNFFGSMAVDPVSFFDVYDEVSVPADQKAKFVQNRRGALVGATLARNFGWKVGDHIVLEGTIFPGQWEFDIDAIYTATRKSFDMSSLYFHWDYLNQSVPEFQREQVGWIASKVPDAGSAAMVARKIDQLFDPRDIQTLSMSERAMNTSFMGMISTMLDAMQLVSFVILLIMMLVLGNTIAMGVRERTHEYGVLRAIGFMPKHLTVFVLGEAAVLGVLGGAVGIAVGIPVIDQGVGRFMEESFTGLFPYFRVLERDVVIALALSMVLSVIAAAVPAYQAGRLHVTDALRKFG
ncbi:MAG TPA: FtsX-like permease family protein [Polyangiales bacterium]|nr:FtsX-like permease family protein [Polyangiales bacterium]